MINCLCPRCLICGEKLLHMQGENVTLRSGVFRLKEAPRQPHIFRVPQIRTWNTLLKDGYPEAVKQEAMTLLDEMSARGEMNADSLRSFYQDFMQMIYFTVGGSEEKDSRAVLPARSIGIIPQRHEISGRDESPDPVCDILLDRAQECG